MQLEIMTIDKIKKSLVNEDEIIIDNDEVYLESNSYNNITEVKIFIKNQLLSTLIFDKNCKCITQYEYKGE